MNHAIVYYIIGFFSGGLCLLLFIMTNGKKIKDILPKPKSEWSKIDLLEFTMDTDHDFKQKVTGQELVFILAQLMKDEIEAYPKGLEKLEIDPGDYTIHVSTRARFIKRN